MILHLSDYRRRPARPPEPAPAPPSAELAAARRLDAAMEEAARFRRFLAERAEAAFVAGEPEAGATLRRGCASVGTLLAELERLRFPGAHE